MNTSIEERMRNVRYVSENEMKNLEKSHVVLDQNGMDALALDITAQLEKGMDSSALSKEEYANLDEVSKQFNSAEPVSIAGSGVTRWAIAKEDKKNTGGTE